MHIVQAVKRLQSDVNELTDTTNGQAVMCWWPR